MSATDWSNQALMDWVDRVKSCPAHPRKEKLKLIASGPCYRDDVQAARRLLAKPRYMDQT